MSGHPSIPQYQSPLGMDLGEFMIDTDLNFMNWSFDQNYPPASMAAREHA